MNKMLFAVLAVAGLLVPAFSGTPEAAVPAARKLAVRAQAVGQDSSDQALAALYNRLFALQDLRREAELTIETEELLIDDIAFEYKRLDRWIDKEALKEIAVNPDDRRYPNITETTKLNLIKAARKHLRTQEVQALNIKKLDRDAAQVEKMIQRHLERPLTRRDS